MKKYLLLFSCVFMFVYSCGSTPEVVAEKPVEVAPVEETLPPVNKNMKFGYVLVPGMDLVETSRGIMIVLDKPVNFELRKSNIQEQYIISFEVVNKFVESNSNTILRLVIEGHTDKTGRANPTNIKLSNQRALVGIEKLSDMGLSRTLMRRSALSEALAEFFGEEEYKNRRLEFIIMKDKNDISKYENAVSELYLKKNR